MKHSETAFLKLIQHDEWEIRWFTPKYEVDLCGHATLAAAFLLFTKGFTQNNKIKFVSKSGPLWAQRDGDSIQLDFPFETTSPLSHDFHFDWEKALGGVKPQNIVEAFGTLKEFLVELKSAEEVENLNPDISEIEKLPGNGLIVTAKGNGPYDIVSRVFAPQDGIPEDPVTASAHSKLAHYWEQRLEKPTFLAYQASKRGGEILVSRKGDRVYLTGSALMTWEGELLLTI
jgi:PhzF family phenazine biosynthesis protein